jgi:hypothetical protein
MLDVPFAVLKKIIFFILLHIVFLCKETTTLQWKCWDQYILMTFKAANTYALHVPLNSCYSAHLWPIPGRQMQAHWVPLFPPLVKDANWHPISRRGLQRSYDSVEDWLRQRVSEEEDISNREIVFICAFSCFRNKLLQQQQQHVHMFTVASLKLWCYSDRKTEYIADSAVSYINFYIVLAHVCSIYNDSFFYLTNLVNGC